MTSNSIQADDKPEVNRGHLWKVRKDGFRELLLSKGWRMRGFGAQKFIGGRLATVSTADSGHSDYLVVRVSFAPRFVIPRSGKYKTAKRSKSKKVPLRKTFSSFFSVAESNNLNIPDGVPVWRINGSGVRGKPEESQGTNQVVKILAEHHISVSSYSMGSPGNVTSYHLEATFQDGGLYAKTGNYWQEKRGAWIYGEKAMEYMAAMLNLK